MSDDYIEKDYDDEVYEDDYYDEHYNEEELYDSEDRLEDDADDDDDDVNNERKVNISYACEECDYRWDDVIIKRKDNIDEDDDYETGTLCPMCGSVNVTLI
jgi:predicted RNA-binding Zn-ribbon protein involved in translation (DUF1610 family)